MADTVAGAFDVNPGSAAWRAVADALPVIVYVVSRDGLVEFVNRRFTAVTGQAARAVLGKSWRALVHPDDGKAIVARWRAAAARRCEFGMELRIRKDDGEYTHFYTTVAPMLDDRGEAARWVGTVAGIDPLRRAEAELRVRESQLTDSERRFQVLAEALPVLCWTADASGWFDWYNRRWYDFTGQTADEAAGWGWQAVHHPDDFLQVMNEWPRSIDTGEPFEMEFRLRDRAGVFHWFLTRAEPLRDESGRVVRWYGSSVNIDAQKRSLTRIREVAEMLREIYVPRQLPKKPGVSIDAAYRPAEEEGLVGGDWYDAFELPDGRLVCSLGDVAGHGLELAGIVGRLRQAIVTLAFSLDEPAAILHAADRILWSQHPNTMATALVGMVNPARSTFTYASAGHPPPLIAARGEVCARNLATGDAPLGFNLDRTISNHAVPIENDSVIVLYTDGMIEYARDSSAGEAKLQAAVALFAGNSAVAKPATAIQELMFEGINPPDDATVMVLQFVEHESEVIVKETGDFGKSWRFHSSHPRTVGTMRAEIVEYLRAQGFEPNDVYAVEVVIGEILANTAKHAPGLVDVQIDWSRDELRIRVRDHGPGMETADANLKNLLSETGRGNVLIQSLSRAVSVSNVQGTGTEIQVLVPIAGQPVGNSS